MDKNKSLYKLNGIPPIYYINLDKSEDRKEYMEDQFQYWGIENYTRISGYDGTQDDLSDILKGKYPNDMNSKDVGCCTSHLKAIKYWYDNSDTSCALIMEDDCDLSVIKYWPFTWKDFYSKIPFDYDIVQLAIINTGSLYIRLHKRFVNDYSTACYLITRHHAKKLLNLCYRDGKYKLDYKAKPRCNSEHLLYESGNTFAIPLLLYSPEQFNSLIWDKGHIDTFHVPCREGLWKFWKNEANLIDKWDEIFDYDPFIGRLSPESYIQKTEP
tara:strand:+ start:8525 stop:9334 length:810 start_codon:yes stop_codon:yes gene_type:complete